MAFRVAGRHLGEIVVLEPQVHQDDRGSFMEAFRADQYRELGLPDQFPQENHSISRRGVVRGLHFQWTPPMGKVMRVTAGAAFLVAVDIRRGSPGVGRWYGIEVTAENRLQVWAPPGFARGFCALVDGTVVQYRCTTFYNPRGESGIRWNDPRIAIDWPVERPLLSDKDSKAMSFDEWLARPESDRLDP
ncbi:MAG TPA: dTDP-4-dehydrorhamnose 3,5-epimerase [Patescibacteria group bacterium]|nr:dTDP-4-dehydrorhamnose 3,5-epimerase [Patescibacteria group bacterium]